MQELPQAAIFCAGGNWWIINPRSFAPTSNLGKLPESAAVDRAALTPYPRACHDSFVIGFDGPKYS
jgi:hypothetical protein